MVIDDCHSIGPRCVPHNLPHLICDVRKCPNTYQPLWASSDQAGDSDGVRVTLRLKGDLDLLILTVRLRLLPSARESSESAMDGERRRRRSVTGLLELLGDLRRRRGGVRDLDTLDGGEPDFPLPLGVIDRVVSLRNLLLSWLGDHDLSFRLRGSGDAESGEGERRLRRLGGDRVRSDEGDLRARRRGGVRDGERSEDGERRMRRGGEPDRLPDGERRRSRDLSRPPRPGPRPPPGT